MPWLLYRAMMAELLRVSALTAWVLVTVIAFGATIKPLATGLLAPSDIAKYVGLAMVPMLQFALPFSAGFGSTMVFHRLVNDNEVFAMAVSGMSYRRILLPIISTGVALTLLLLVLVHFVIPSFWGVMQRTIERDIARLVEASVNKGEAFVVGDMQIYAEAVEVEPDPPGASEKRMYLAGVVAAETDEFGVIKAYITARFALVDFFTERGETSLRLAMQQGHRFDAAKGQLVWFPELELPNRILLQNTFANSPKFMSLPQILYVRANPNEYSRVIRQKSVLGSALERVEAWASLEAMVASDRRIEFVNEDRTARFVLRGERLRSGVLTRARAGDLEVEVHQAGVLTRRIQCGKAEIELVQMEDSRVRFNIVLDGCTVEDQNGQAEPYEQARYLISGVETTKSQGPDLSGLHYDELLARARSGKPDRAVLVATTRLEQELEQLQREATARISQRNALATTGCLLLILGSVLAIRMRESLPLSIYLLAFLPSVLDILVISGGEQMMRDGALGAGFVVMWSGNAVLLGFAVFTFLRVARN